MLTYAAAFHDVVQVACGGDHTLVLLRNGSLYGFGKNANGQVCSRMLTCAHVCSRMLSVCSRVLTCAHRMLTYTDVC
jgi:alpha-tubulin suppressor-like RCC1 family protein